MSLCRNDKLFLVDVEGGWMKDSGFLCQVVIFDDGCAIRGNIQGGMSVGVY